MAAFKVIGVGRNNKRTELQEFDTSSEAIRWAERYVSKENAGNWNHIQVVDKRSVSLTIWQWSK